MSFWSNDYKKLKLVMLPSLEEIRDYEGDGIYAGGYGAYRDEATAVLRSTVAAFFQETSDIEKQRWPRIDPDGLHGDITKAGHFPQFIFDTALTLVSSGGAAVGFYKAVKLWADLKNGRKLRIRLPSGFEVETTQLSSEQFSKLCAEIYQLEKASPVLDEDKLRKHGQEVGITFVSPDDAEAERREIRDAASDSILKRRRSND